MWQDMAKSLNVVKSFKDSMGKHSFMARSSVPIRQYYDRPGESVDSWHELGKNEWYDDEGTVSQVPLAYMTQRSCCKQLPCCASAGLLKDLHWASQFERIAAHFSILAQI